MIRVDHFEFRGNRFVSDTLYRSEFILLDNNSEIDYRGRALRIANELASLKRQANTQLALFYILLDIRQTVVIAPIHCKAAAAIQGRAARSARWSSNSNKSDELTFIYTTTRS